MLIGISGKKQSGKDTVCKIIQRIESYLYKVRPDETLSTREEVIYAVEQSLNKPCSDSAWEKHAFADALKACAGIILDVPVPMFENEKFKNSSTTLDLLDSDNVRMTNRKFLQLLGTEVGRSIDQDLWVKVLTSKYRSKFSQMVEYGYDESGKRVPIETVVMEPCWIVTDTRFPNEADAIKREGGLLIRVNRNTEVSDTHASETALDNYEGFDEMIDNNGSIEDLIGQVYDIMLKHKLV